MARSAAGMPVLAACSAAELVAELERDFGQIRSCQREPVLRTAHRLVRWRRRRKALRRCAPERRGLPGRAPSPGRQRTRQPEPPAIRNPGEDFHHKSATRRWKIQEISAEEYERQSIRGNDPRCGVHRNQPAGDDAAERHSATESHVIDAHHTATHLVGSDQLYQRADHGKSR